jgi:hypothetical protein
MEIVHVLGYEAKIGFYPLKPGKGVVSGIRLLL